MPSNTYKSIISNEVHDIVFLEILQESLAIGSWEVDIISNTVTWSAITKKIHEVPSSYIPDVVNGINFYKEGKSRDRITLLFNACVSNGESFDEEFTIITAKNKEKYVRAIGHPKVVDGKIIAIRGIFQDITKKTEETKNAILKEKQFRSLFDNSLTGMAIVSLDGDWLRVNKSICDVLGYSEEEFLRIGFREITHPKDRNLGDKEISMMLSNELDNFQTEKRYIHKNGRIVHCILSASLVRNVEGIAQHFVSNIIDISKMKTANNKIKKLLEISSNQNERLINFANIVSHNLRSHGGNLKMLLQLKKDELPETIDNEYYPLIEKAVGNLNETIGNLNDVAVISSSKNKELEPLNLLNYTNKTIDSLRALVLSNNASIEVAINEDVQVMALPAYLDSILINFLTNAIKYKRPDVDPNITLEAKKEDKGITLIIKDNGLGIDLELHGDKLFGLYNVFHDHKDSKGLGLFITKNQIDSMDGKIDVESKVGQGTTFKILFKR